MNLTPLEVYNGSDGAATTALYEQLRARGPIGHVAECIFRAQKKSSRAKVYSRRYRSMSYEDKTSSMSQLVKMLDKHGADLGFRYGWKPDPAVVFGDRASFVLYVDIPAAFGPGIVRQVSFHAPERGEGPEYPGEWDGIRGASEQRVIDLAAYVLTLPEVETLSPVMPFGKWRGSQLQDVPETYLAWIEENSTNLSPALRDAINHELARRSGSNAGRVVREAGA
jgi:hypothetical protein